MSLVVRNLPEQIVDLVRDRILTGRIDGTGAIRQDALAADLGVSKIPLREALARLEQEGLVTAQPNRGFFVRPMSAAEMEEVYALRLKVEPDAMVRAAMRALPTEVDEAEATLAILEDATASRATDVGRANRAFHLALIRPARQPVTAQILERLHVLSDRYVRKHLEPTGRDARASEEHRAILDAWRGRDGPQVAALTRDHIQSTLDDLRQQFAVE